MNYRQTRILSGYLYLFPARLIFHHIQKWLKIAAACYMLSEFKKNTVHVNIWKVRTSWYLWATKGTLHQRFLYQKAHALSTFDMSCKSQRCIVLKVNAILVVFAWYIVVKKSCFLSFSPFLKLIVRYFTCYLIC